MDLPAVVRSMHTWDTAPGRDLRCGELAVVVDVVETRYGGWVWRLISLDNPRLLEISTGTTPERVLQKWLVPA